MKRAKTILVDFLLLPKSASSMNDALCALIARELGLTSHDYSEMLTIATKQCPLLILFDEIGALEQQEFAHWKPREEKDWTPQVAMKLLGFQIQRILAISKVHVYCTGRTSYVSLLAMVGANTSFYPCSVVLRPLRANSIQDMFTDSQLCPIRLSCISSDKSVISHLCKNLVRFTGGDGRLVEKSLERLANICSTKSLDSVEDVDNSLAAMYIYMRGDTILGSQIALGADTWESHLLLLASDYLIHKKTFSPKFEVRVQGCRTMVCFTHVLSALGFSYTIPEDPEKLQVVAGEWPLV